MSDDNWVKAAMDDTDLVVEVLLGLHQASRPSHPKPDTPPPPLGWSIRQRRSRPQVLLPAAAKKSPAARASPTTPLSWSGATSISGGGGVGNVDGIEESSRPIPNRSDISRSKVVRPNETTPTKRPRKKKTLPELKEDETMLLKERKQLKRQLATLQATYEKQRKENESLKKMKMNMQSQQQGVKPEAFASGEPHQTVACSEVNGCIKAKKEDEFVLPDLNIPAGEDE